MLLKFSLIIFLQLFPHYSLAIQCYQCNSLTTSDCEKNYEKFGKICRSKTIQGRNFEAIGCREIKQYVDDHYSIDRSCAYLGENEEQKIE
ncbi:unnamed protein product [Caenorhabditis angaria]|uniref:Protein sleepless n=1 Tax=Caenorhabditis angaria TaxID=860376 RepID=A0A9P1IQ50_9PELO|nr:unnamed protein product [Caenorhabditis angaria]